MKRQSLLLATALTSSSMLLGQGAYAEEAKAGLPQLNTAMFPEQLFWLALSFGLLYVLMSRVALPKISATQDTRRAAMAADLAAAQTANDNARTMMAQYEKALADARIQAQATISEITASAAKESASKQATQQQAIAMRLSEAEAKINASRDAAIKGVKDEAANLAKSIVERVSGGGMATR
jgi:F-type H+-transporting ATPase subunit b